MKIPVIERLNLPKLIQAASHLPLHGKLKISPNDLAYLDIDNAYIHQLFNFLNNKKITIPHYFGEKSAGAHITVIYPEEKTTINKNDLDQNHHFIIKDIVSA